MFAEFVIGTVMWIVGWSVVTLLRNTPPEDTHDYSRCDCWSGHKSNQPDVA